MKKILLLFFTLLLTTGLGFADTEFKDTKGHWAVNYINSLKSTNIISGYEDGTFRPSSDVKVNEFIAMTVRALGYNLESKSSDWAKPYIDKAIELKLIEDREFLNYSVQITREQMTSIAMNALVRTMYRPDFGIDEHVKRAIKDYHLVDDYYKQNLVDAYKIGLTNGYTDGTFKPKGYSTRAEATAVISKMLNPDMLTPFEAKGVKSTYVRIADPSDYSFDTATTNYLYYAPVYNGKVLNEVVDVLRIYQEYDTKIKGSAKFITMLEGLQLNVGFSTTGYESYEKEKAIYDIPLPLERAFAVAEQMDWIFSINFNPPFDATMIYDITVFKDNYLGSEKYSNYFLSRYGLLFENLFKVLFESDYEKTWAEFVRYLDYNGEYVRIDSTINTREVLRSYSNAQTGYTFSIKGVK